MYVCSRGEQIDGSTRESLAIGVVRRLNSGNVLERLAVSCSYTGVSRRTSGPIMWVTGS